MSTNSEGTVPKLKRRSPRGTINDKPIAVRLLPGERQKLEAIAEKEQRCLSNMIRQLVLMGLQAYATAK